MNPNTLTLKAAKRTLTAAGYTDREIAVLVRGIKADAWDKGAHALWQLADPLWTCDLDGDAEVVTKADYWQATHNNPYRDNPAAELLREIFTEPTA